MVSPDLTTAGLTSTSVIAAADKSVCPRITIAPQHLMGGMTPATGFIIKNVGELELHNLRFETVALGIHDMVFPNNIPMIPQGESTAPVVPTIKSLGSHVST